MLTMIWAGLFFMGAIGCGFFAGYAGYKERGALKYAIFGLLFGVVTFIMLYEVVIVPVFVWLCSVLPQDGEMINLLTAFAISLVGWSIILSLIVILPLYVGENIAENTDKQFAKI